MSTRSRDIDYWGASTAVFSLAIVTLFGWWQYVDRMPPAWDEAGYLLLTWEKWRALVDRDPLELYRLFLSSDPGRPNVLPLIGTIGFWAFGPSDKAALMPFALLWLIGIAAIYDVARNAAERFFDQRDGRPAGLLAVALFALYPATQALSHVYLTEFPLVVAVAALHAAAMRFWISGRAAWAFAVGFAGAIGMLGKVTFLPLAVAPAGLLVWRMIADRSWSRAALVAGVSLIPIALIPAPFYVRNLHEIVAVSTYLSSAGLASLYGLGGGLDPRASLAFIGWMLSQYEFLLCVLAAAALGVWVLLRPRASRLGYLLLAMSAVSLFVIVALSNFKTERYAYPAFAALFVLGGGGLALPWTTHRGIGGLAAAALFAIPVLKLGVTYGLVPPPLAFLDRASARLGLMLAVHAPPPNRSDWNIRPLVDELAGVSAKGRPIYIIGGSPQFQAQVLRFESLRAGRDQAFAGFVYQQHPGLAHVDLLRSIASEDPAAVLHKSPPYTPSFLGAGVDETVRELSRSPEYERQELKTVQPDGSRFVLFHRTERDNPVRVFRGAADAEPYFFGTMHRGPLRRRDALGGDVLIDLGRIGGAAAGSSGTMPDKKLGDPLESRSDWVENYGLLSGEDKVYTHPGIGPEWGHYRTNRHGAFTYGVILRHPTSLQVSLDFWEQWNRRPGERIFTLEVSWDGNSWVDTGEVDPARLNGPRPFSIVLFRRDVRVFQFRMKPVPGTKDIPMMQGVRLRRVDGKVVEALELEAGLRSCSASGPEIARGQREQVKVLPWGHESIRRTSC